MNTKHTPGPWKQHQTEGKTYASVRGVNNETVADCGSRSDSQAHANARLIAVAPELLEVAKAFCIDHTMPCGCENCAVIRKAEGDSK